MRDNIPEGDEAQIPLQLVFELANCKIFYTYDTAMHPSKLWEKVHRIAWKGGKCACGGMNTDVGNNGTGVSGGSGPGSGSGSGNGTRPLVSNNAGRFEMGVLMAAVVGVAAVLQML